MGENDANICKHRLPLCITGINMAIAVILYIPYLPPTKVHLGTLSAKSYSKGLRHPLWAANVRLAEWHPAVVGDSSSSSSLGLLWSRSQASWARTHSDATWTDLREISFALVCSPHFLLPFMSFYFFDAPRQLKIQHSTHIMIASQCQQSRWLMTCISAMVICDDPMVRTLGCLIQSHSNILSRRRLLDLGEIALLRKKMRRADSSL